MELQGLLEYKPCSSYSYGGLDSGIFLPFINIERHVPPSPASCALKDYNSQQIAQVQSTSKNNPKCHENVPVVKNRPELKNKRDENSNGLRKFYCTICCKPFNQEHRSKEHVYTHMSWDELEKRICNENCGFCGKMFRSGKSYLKHLRKKHAATLTPQQVMNGYKNYTHRSSTPTVEQSEHFNIPKKPIEKSTNNKALKKSTQNQTLQIRQKSKNGRKSSFCYFCGKTFLSDNLGPHLLTHTKERPFKCSMCKVECIQKIHLLKHEKFVHGKSNIIKNKNRKFHTRLATQKAMSIIHRKRKIQLRKKRQEDLRHRRDKIRKHVAIERHPGPINQSSENNLLENIPPSPPLLYEQNENETPAGPAPQKEGSKDSRKYICTHIGCDKTFTKNFYLKQHEATHGSFGSRRFPCSLCHWRFTQKAHRIKHEKRIHKEFKEQTEIFLKVKANTAPKSVKKKQVAVAVQRRLVKATNATVPKLKTKKVAAQKSKSTNDINKSGQNMSRKFPCSFCPWRFTQKVHRIRHENRIHKNFKQETEIFLKAEATTNSTAPKFKTKKDAKSTNDVRKIVQHGGRKFPCSFCPWRFNQKAHRINHEKRIHKKDFNEQPQIFMKAEATTAPKSLKKKQVAVAVQKPKSTNEVRKKSGHCCYFCDKGFSAPFFLSRHLASHTKESPFKCSLCGKEFTQKVHLTKHEQRHKTITKKFNCEDCGWKFQYEKELKIHQDWKCCQFGKTLVIKCYDLINL